mmetsp:Transcript_9231/g.20024  ORF Transcript_9231/g.20024 Transcript_9231/m.20024 type:complete len:120 (+) Transcript_9231:96-455(+)
MSDDLTEDSHVAHDYFSNETIEGGSSSAEGSGYYYATGTTTTTRNPLWCCDNFCCRHRDGDDDENYYCCGCNHACCCDLLWCDARLLQDCCYSFQFCECLFECVPHFVRCVIDAFTNPF